MTETEGEKKNHWGKRTDNRSKEKGQNMENTHLLGGCHVGVIFTIKLGKFCDFGTKPAHQERVEPYIYI